MNDQDKLNELNREFRYEAAKGSIEKIELLLERGAKINASDALGYTALHEAVFQHRLDVIRLFIKKGADINAQDMFGDTPLHKAASLVRFSIEKLCIVTLLIENGADVNAKNENGKTPLHNAAREGNLDIMKFLIEKGADVNAKDRDEKTLLHYALDKGREDIAELIVNRIAKLKQEAQTEKSKEDQIKRGIGEVIEEDYSTAKKARMEEVRKRKNEKSVESAAPSKQEAQTERDICEVAEGNSAPKKARKEEVQKPERQHSEEVAEGATPSKRACMEDAVIESLVQLSLQ